MKKDILISFLVFMVTALMVFIVTRPFFLTFASEYKIIAGFVKFFFLASIGDFIALRLKSKEWRIPKGMFYKAIIWGIIGVVVVLMFEIYPIGVFMLQDKGILPFKGSELAFAFFVSFIMNFTFAPTMMSAHRITDTYIEMNMTEKTTIGEAIDAINWKQYIGFTVFKAIPFFWVPAHTITFLLPDEFRIIFAAVLGIFLGLLLGVFKNKK